MKASLLASAVASVLAFSQSSFAQVKKVEQIIVTASPLGRADSELAQPATVLGDDELRRKRAASIGDTLSSETGVQSSSFGPGAGRPIIRGLDGARVRVLENGIGTLDASTVSPDHMVTTESLHADQIEILRGPASLLYGSGAIGGIVNVVSNLIPRVRADGLSGNVELRGATGNDEQTGAVNLDGGSGDVAWHLDAFRRKTSDYKIPGHVVRDDPDSPAGRLPDTAIDAKGGGAGVSWVTDRGYWGVGVEGLSNVYGIPSGEGSRIDLSKKKFETSGEMSNPFAGFTRLKFRLGHTDYQHEEIESSGEVATTFRNKATESRFELAHAAISGFTGTLGLQLQDEDLSALGEEAVIPRTRSRAQGLFLVEQRDFGDWIFDAGARIERSTRRPTVDAASFDRFANAIARDFTLATPALGVVWKLSPDYRFSVNATQAQRAPSTEELYSNGAHAATATFDIGAPGLRKEVSRNLDVTLRRVTGETRWKLNFFVNRIKDYVHPTALDADGDGIADRYDADGVLVPDGEFLAQRFTQAEARFHGLEAEWTWKPEGGPGLRVFGDYVRGRLSDGDNLPRMSPARAGVEVDHRVGAFSGSVSAIHGFAQRMVAPLETPTPGYTKVDAEMAWQLSSEKGNTFTFFLQGSNLLDREIRLHTSYLKDVAPLMGRSFTLGLRAEF